jgi:hypothetical protein
LNAPAFPLPGKAGVAYLQETVCSGYKKGGIDVLTGIFRFAAAVAVLVLAGASICPAQDTSPVRISFDRVSKRTDLVTGRTLPNYVQAQRGSFQFFYGRLDTPENGFWYFFDGRRFQSVDRTLFIRKLKTTGTWVIAGTGRWGEPDQTKDAVVPAAHPNTNCEILHHAVSFIPLNSATGKPEPRVHVLLEDLELIQWHPYHHWLAEESQETIEAKRGVVY